MQTAEYHYCPCNESNRILRVVNGLGKGEVAYMDDADSPLAAGFEWTNSINGKDYENLMRSDTDLWTYDWDSQDRSADPSWKVRVILRGTNLDHLRQVDIRNVLELKHILFVTLAQRIDESTYKEVMRYGHGVYGNDLTSKSLGLWDQRQGMPKDLEEFLKPLHPRAKPGSIPAQADASPPTPSLPRYEDVLALESTACGA
ncbi:hypothetical protein Cob_v012204 [Colletotrichum orbiculare MAFF 240422]|uniref:Uncharacterized protein n=1 Tax=Colletotrichum orbiculare (strain 104-T / ATCC 96160 / CBS 514.97 / LARS 414 / MAFF 240422) TaxID=1213857 RepID=A0A484FBP0_COLOR|nr:hypothetical protein Cob_v012204 [Colletotrichum orbiculare MAFF 240422]